MRSALSAAAGTAGARRGGWGTVVVLLTADTIYGFQQTAITPVLPVVQADLHASRGWTIWLFSGYLIVASVAAVFLGKLADRLGRRRVYLASLVIFLLGSVGAAVSPSILVLVLCRLVQGVGGVVFPLSFAIVTEVLPRDRVQRAIGVLTGGFGLGAMAGFPLGGLIAQELSWRWIFGIGAAALIFAIVLVRAAVPVVPPGPRRGLDTPGALLLGGAMAALIAALTEGPQRGWDSAIVVALFLAAAAAAAAWWRRELHTPEPLMDLRVLASRRVLLVNITSLLGGYAVLGVNVVMPFLLIGTDAGPAAGLLGLGAGPLLVGVALLPRALGQAAGGPLLGAVSRVVGDSGTLVSGMVLTAAAAAGLALWRAQLWQVLVELAVLGVGFGLTIGVSASIVGRASRADETGIAMSITSVVRRVGGGIGVQVSAALLAGTASARAFTAAFSVAAVVAAAGAVSAVLVGLGPVRARAGHGRWRRGTRRPQPRD